MGEAGGSGEVVPPADGWRMTDKRMIRRERVRQLDVTNGEGGSEAEGWGWEWGSGRSSEGPRGARGGNGPSS